MTECLPSWPVLFWDRCQICNVRSLTSRDGLTYLCANCGDVGVTEGLERNTGWDAGFCQQQSPHVVYYIRFGNRVKIGTTANLAQRLAALPHDEILATEPGSYDLEKRRHQQLRASRIYANREWFHLTDEVRKHIASLPKGHPL